MKKYQITYKSTVADGIDLKEKIVKIIFDDVQWRDYGVSATRDEKEFESKLTTVIPYTSIHEVIILSDEDE